MTVSSYDELRSYAESSEPYVILVEGTISDASAGGRINVQSNKSSIGVGSTAFLSGIGLNISSTNNIILQNLRATLVGTTAPADVNGGDIIGIQGTSNNICIDHCELFSEDPDQHSWRGSERSEPSPGDINEQSGTPASRQRWWCAAAVTYPPTEFTCGLPRCGHSRRVPCLGAHGTLTCG